MPVAPEIANIANMACLALKVAAPSSIEDDSDLAQDLRLNFPDARDRCLEAADWSFATSYRSLALLTEFPTEYLADPDLPYTYAFPSGARKILQVGDGLCKWRRDADGIRAELPPPLAVRVTVTSPQETLWPAEFRNAVAMTLAAMLAPKWMSAASDIDALERRAERSMKQAMRNHGPDASLMRYDGQPDEGDWLSEARQ